MKKEQTLLLTLLFGALVVLLLLIFSRNTPSTWTQKSPDGTAEISAEFVGNDNWRYTIKGYKPTPCYSYKVKVTNTSLSYYITLQLIEPLSEQVCDTVIVPFEEIGNVRAPQNATFNFYTETLDNKPSIPFEVTDQTIQIEKDNFVLYANYEGDNIWDYKIEGNLPNPCYSIHKDAIVMESFPEQVNVIVTVKRNTQAEVCVQVIVDVDERGSFSASEQAKITLLVNRPN